jgi:serine/threonine-protein kinase
VVLFELLTGARPFVADSLAELVLVINQDDPLDPKSLRPDLPSGLCQIIKRCLEKDPNRRYPDVAELSRDLSPHGWGEAPRNSDVQLPPAQLGTHGTLVVNGDHPDLVRLAQMAESVLGPSPGGTYPSVPPAREESSAVGIKTSSPWSSTNGEPKEQRPKGRAALWLALAAAAGFIIVGALALFFVSGANEDGDEDAAIVSAASELAQATPAEETVPVSSQVEARETPSAAPSPGPTIATTVPSVLPDGAGSSDAPEAQTPKKVIRRPRSDEPKSAKDRLGF